MMLSRGHQHGKILFNLFTLAVQSNFQLTGNSVSIIPNTNGSPTTEAIMLGTNCLRGCIVSN
jgi:hypothetical protein